MPEKAGAAGAAPNGPREGRGPEAEIRRRIEASGPITFAEFMEVALFWPDGGYYTSGRETWGPGGDYFTNVDISPLFATMLAKQVHEMWLLLGSPGDFTLVEAGAGRGLLTEGILSAVRSRYPELASALKAVLVEKNPNLRRPPEEGVVWREEIGGIDPGFEGCILSNELIDSFPVHRVRLLSGSLKELYVGCDGARFVDLAGEPSTPALAGYLRDAGVGLAEGQTTEINLRAGPWIAEAAGLLSKGFVITVDYGWPARELYGPDRMRGTLMCHYRHTINDDPYTNIGDQDITAHVDFTTLAAAGRRAGLELTGFTTQKNMLLGMGITEEFGGVESLDIADIERVRFNQSVKELIMPGGPGDVFKVLVQHRGIERPALAAFSFRDMSPTLLASGR
ncbi:MAG: class I SAM-dependent methyltransferase [Thermodesulfobacteriota bacterium]